ncbi:MAG: protein kinase [Planctomycetes bacterium]|nr:protein kinase [Planctomycetota bacterium]
MTRPPDVSSLVGYVIGKCKLLRVCGRGAMGTVYEGQHTGLDIDVAVKVLPPHLASNGNLVQRFLREAKLAAKLNHSNTVRVYDVGEESGYYYLVMEFVRGSDALALVKTYGPQSAAVVADIGAGAARALSHAHAAEVVHRDIKPANLMLPEGGGVKVADFGLARALASDSGLTMTGAVMGTPDYMAPEQAQGKMAGPAADAYSLGCTLYHLFVGRPPYSASNPMAVALMHVTNRVLVPEDRQRDEADRTLAKIIFDLTEKDVNKRPSDMNLIAERLAAIARMRRKATQKLVSEGGTLFDTAGLKLQTKIWEASQMRAASSQVAAAASTAAAGTPVPKPAAPPPPMVDDATRKKLQPALDALKNAASQARAKAGSEILPMPAPIADVSDLTPELVREAKARARRSSGSMPAVPSELGEERPKRGGTNPPSTPTEDRTASGRRAGVAAGSNVDDAGWEEYSAKAFPTFERTDSSAGVATRQAAQPASADASAPWATRKTVAPPTDRAVVSGDMMAADRGTTGGRRAKKSSGSGIGILVVLLLLGGAAFALWYFYFQPKTNATNNAGIELPPLDSFVVESRVWAAHKPGSAVTDIANLGNTQKFVSAGFDGSAHLWGPPYEAKLHSYSPGGGSFKYLASNHDGSRVVVATGDGRVISLTGGNLGVSNDKLGQAGEVTSLVWALRGVMFTDAKGNLLRTDGSAPIVVSKTGAAVTAAVINGDDLWLATAANELALYDIKSQEPQFKKGFQNLPGAIDKLVATSLGVFAIVGGTVRSVTEAGLSEPRYSVSDKVACASGARDGKNEYLVVVAGGALTYLDVRAAQGNFQIACSLQLPADVGLTSLSPGPLPRSVIGGTRDGKLIMWTEKKK